MQIEPEFYLAEDILPRYLAPGEWARSSGAFLCIGRIGHDNIKSSWIDGLIEPANVVFDRDNVPFNAVVFSVLFTELDKLRLYFNRIEQGAGVLFCEGDGDDAGAGAGFQNPFFGFDAAEIGKKNAVEGKAVPFLGLADVYDAGAAKRDAVPRKRRHFTFSTYSVDRRLGLPFASTYTSFALHSTKTRSEAFSRMICSNIIVARVTSRTRVSISMMSPYRAGDL